MLKFDYVVYLLLTVFVLRYFVFTSFWAYKIYYVYGFMLLVFAILAVVTVCVTIVCTYFLLNAEDYRWSVSSGKFLLSLNMLSLLLWLMYCGTCMADMGATYIYYYLNTNIGSIIQEYCQNDHQKFIKNDHHIFSPKY